MDSSYTTRGGQIFFHNLRMFLQIQGWAFKVGFFLAVAVAALYSYFILDRDTVYLAYSWVKFNLMDVIQPDRIVIFSYHGQSFRNTVHALSENATLHDAYRKSALEFGIALLGSLASVGVLLYFTLRFFSNNGKKRTENKFIRGTTIASPKELARKLRKLKKQSTLVFDGLKIFKKDFEVQHVLLDGTTGSGKSVALRKLLKWIRKRGDKAIIYDKGCTFVGNFYNPETDYILNPFDERSAYWDVWLDGQEESDYENIASALIPQSGEGDPFWVTAARTIFTSTSYKMGLEEKEQRSTQRLLEIMLTSELEDLGAYVKGTESSTLVSEKAAKMAISIKSILAAYIKSLRFLEGLDEKDTAGKERPRLSIKDWVQNDAEKGFLFLSSNAEQHVSLRPLISTWLAIASTSLLGLKPDSNRRIWVIMDEMPTLHKLPELAETIAEVRKFGGCYLIGIQSFAQLQKNYGKNTADELFDLLNTRLFFRAPSEPMARVTSADLGEVEFEEKREQYSYGAAQVRDGVTLGSNRIKQAAVSSTEVMQLEDLEFYLKNSGKFPISKIQMKYDKFKEIHPPFMKRELPRTRIGKRLDSLIAWNQLVALQKIDESDKNKLLHLYDSTLSDDPESVRKQKMEKFESDIKDNSSRQNTTLDTSEEVNIIEDDFVIDDDDVAL